MFKVIKIDMFDTFACTMDKCPDNCCDEKWVITVDDDTYEKYVEMGIENLDEKITRDEPHVLIKDCNGKCPFILENGLCYLHKNLGEDYLSNTCKSYPRFVSTYGDLYIENIGLSCPAAAESLVNRTDLCSLVENVYYEDNSEVGTRPVELVNERLMKEAVAPFYEATDYASALLKSCKLTCKDDGTESSIPKLEYLAGYELILKNISIMFLFEHIMLESVNDNPDYDKVYNNLFGVLSGIDDGLATVHSAKGEIETVDLWNNLYKAMREYDHVGL